MVGERAAARGSWKENGAIVGGALENAHFYGPDGMMTQSPKDCIIIRPCHFEDVLPKKVFQLGAESRQKLLSGSSLVAKCYQTRSRSICKKNSMGFILILCMLDLYCEWFIK